MEWNQKEKGKKPNEKIKNRRQKLGEEGSRVDAKAAVVPAFLARTEWEGRGGSKREEDARNTVVGLRGLRTRGRTKRRMREHEIPMDFHHSQPARAWSGKHDASILD